MNKQGVAFFVPVNPDEPVRQRDLNSAIEGLAWQCSYRVATQANTSLASHGSSIDGVTLASGGLAISGTRETRRVVRSRWLS